MSFGWRVAALAVITGILGGCGGGGGSTAGSGNGQGVTPPPSNNTASISVTPLNVGVSARAGQNAPSATVQISITAQASQVVYLDAAFSNHGIANLSSSNGASPVSLNITFQSPGTLGPGVYTDTVTIKGCYDQSCTQQVGNSPQTVQVQYTVTASLVTVTSLTPASVPASGPPFTLTVNGTNFTSQSVVQWNGSPRATTFVSATQLTAAISGSDVATAGTATISVSDSINGPSNSLTFTIQAAQLTLKSLSPTSAAVGGAPFMLTVLGSGFSNTSTVLWNGSARATNLITPYELTAQITAADIASLGTASVTVQDPDVSGSPTAAQTFSISPVSIDAVAFQITPAHTGGVSFSNITLPSAAAWSVDVGGTPSYALIASGKVFVTATLSGGGSELVALDQATGTKVWGPIAIGGNANAAYDSGKVFVLSSAFGTTATMLAFDAQTGNQLWSTLLTGQYAFSAAPTAANGFVYTGGAGSGGTLYAVDQTNGAIAWTQGVENGDNSVPAVTADGVYVSYPCWTYDFRPATGDSIWSNNTGCEGGGGATPVVANQILYSPNNPGGYNGLIYNAENGASSGTYTADSPPAFSATTGYFLQGGTLRAITQSNNTILGSFAGDGQLAGAPIVVGQYVFIGSSSGNLYGLDNSLHQVWQVTLPNPIVASPNRLPFSGLSAGDGLLVVPAGTKVNAFVLSTNP